MTVDLPEELARRVELCSAWRGVRYAEAYQRLHPDAQTAVIETAGGSAVYLAPESPLNSARAMGLTGPVKAADLEDLEEFYRQRGVNTILHVCPLADKGLIELVRERGYVLHHFFSVLVRAIPASFKPAPLPPGMTVRPAAAHEAGQWLLASAQGFESTSEPSEAIFDILGPNFHAEDSVPYTAWIKDREGHTHLVGTGGMYLYHRVRAFELGGASTLMPFRRMGVQRALIEARLAEGLRQGCDLAMVLTSPGTNSERNLFRAGFRLAYTKVVMEKLLD